MKVVPGNGHTVLSDQNGSALCLALLPQNITHSLWTTL